MQPKKKDFIDALRGLAALYVLVFHFSLITTPMAVAPSWLAPITGIGGAGVTLFFVGIDRGDLPLNDEFKTFHPFEDNIHRGGPDVVVRPPFEGADLVELDRHTFGSVGSIVGKGKLQFGVLRGDWSTTRT